MTTFLRIMDRAADHWAAHAGQWSRIDSPLRPHADDVALVQAWLAQYGPTGHAGCGLLLGVTPELAAQGSHTVIAVDRERAMVDMLRSHARAHAHPGDAIQGNWLALPFTAGSLDFALGDGSFNLLRYPDDYHALFNELKRVLRSNAPLILRIFTAPSQRESSLDIIDEAMAGRIASFHAFKWRLAMSLATARGDANIGVADIHREFERLAPDRTMLAQQSGWDRSSIDTIDVYCGSRAVYSFPSAMEWRTIAERYSVELARDHGDYELAECCPSVVSRLLA